jgi:predicted MFS family arabinose efflux permease
MVSPYAAISSMLKTNAKPRRSLRRPVICDQLLHNDRVSFAWTIRIVGFVMIPLLVITVLTVRLPKEAKVETESGRQEKPKVDRKELRKEIGKPPFLLLIAALFFAYLGFFTPYYYVSTYATHLGFSQRLAFYLVSVINAASLVGRILAGSVADRMGRFNFLILSMLSAAVVAFCWTAATEVAGVIIWTLAYGFASGVSDVICLQAASTYPLTASTGNHESSTCLCDNAGRQECVGSRCRCRDGRSLAIVSPAQLTIVRMV